MFPDIFTSEKSSRLFARNSLFSGSAGRADETNLTEFNKKFSVLQSCQVIPKHQNSRDSLCFHHQTIMNAVTITRHIHMDIKPELNYWSLNRLKV